MYACIISNCLHVCSSFTESLGNNVFTVQVNQAANGARTRTGIQVLDRHDGSYLVRYKLWQGYQDVAINVLYNGQHIASSPYTLSGILNCSCASCTAEHKSFLDLSLFMCLANYIV